MRKIELQIDETRLRDHPQNCGPRLALYLLACAGGTRPAQSEFEYFREIGITVTVDGVAPHTGTEVTDEERAL